MISCKEQMLTNKSLQHAKLDLSTAVSSQTSLKNYADSRHHTIFHKFALRPLLLQNIIKLSRNLSFCLSNTNYQPTTQRIKITSKKTQKVLIFGDVSERHLPSCRIEPCLCFSFHKYLNRFTIIYFKFKLKTLIIIIIIIIIITRYLLLSFLPIINKLSPEKLMKLRNLVMLCPFNICLHISLNTQHVDAGDDDNREVKTFGGCG